LKIDLACILEAVLNELISGFGFAPSAGPFDELTILIPWHKPMHPMLKMFEALKVARCDGVKGVFPSFHPFLWLGIESRDHRPNPVG